MTHAFHAALTAASWVDDVRGLRMRTGQVYV